MKPRVPFGSSLRARVMIGVLVPLIVVLGFAAYVQFAGHRDLMLENLEQVSVSVGDGVEASLRHGMLTRDNAMLAEVAQNLAARSSIRNLMILDKEGNVRIASRASDLGTRLPLSDSTCQVCHQSTLYDSSRSIVLTLADGSRVFRNVTPIRNQVECQGCHGSTARLNGILVVDLPYESVDAHLWADLRQNILLALAAIVLVAVAIYVSLSRIVISKLERFGEALMRYARGDFSARVPVAGDDEIGNLARTMNAMAQGLGEKAQLEREVRSTAEELELKSARLGALYRVALESSRSLDLDQVMRAGLENALAVMEMHAGEIHLVEPPPHHLRLRASVGTPPDFAREEELICKGECFCGSIVGSRQTSVISDLDPDKRVTRLACRRHGFRAVAAVPLKARGQALGVLTLHNRMPREFSEDELALLSALGDQLGVAIENAQLYTEMESRVQELSRQLQHLAVLKERVRLGREMHDGFAQALSVLNLKLQMAQGGNNGPVANTLAEMREIVDATYEDVRQAISDLRMPLTPDASIVATLSDYAQNFALRYNLQAQIKVAPEAAEARCSPDVLIQVIRITQEALANVRKHAHAEHLEVRFVRIDGRLKIQIRDDGHGFVPTTTAPAPGHYGLSIMRERAASYNGELEVHSQPGAGTTISLTVPVEGG
jgi:two-component system nitrate/nitrite sensor histidine kinase NarX